MKQKQSGFTLVEIAIVLVIIGLLLGGVLKGQEMVESSRAKSIANDMRAVQVAMSTYRERFRAMPGDEPALSYTNRGGTCATAAPAIAGGNNDGVLAAPVGATFTAAGGENISFWQALYCSGLLAGNPAAGPGVAMLPRHAGGGMIGVNVGSYNRVGQITICASGLTTAQARQIDILIDGPLPATGIGNNAGDLQGAQGPAAALAPVAVAPPATAYTDGVAGNWTMCLRA